MSQVKVGCCGFPKGKKVYFPQFSLVEVQQTFYKPPSLATALKWRQEAPADFEFTLKAWQLITHPTSSPTYQKAGVKITRDQAKNYGFFKPSDQVFEAWLKTRDVAKALEARAIVFQCPPRFTETAENIENVRAFFSKVNREDFLFVWELRGDWKEKRIASLCRELDLVHCVDPLVTKPVFGKIKYFRLHGGPRYRHEYSQEELERLRDQISGETYVLFNNITMYGDALQFLQLLKRKVGR